MLKSCTRFGRAYPAVNWPVARLIRLGAARTGLARHEQCAETVEITCRGGIAFRILGCRRREPGSLTVLRSSSNECVD